MKKSISIISVILLLCTLVFSFPVFAASGSLSGPATVRAGDTITLSLNISASSAFGAEGTFSYDSSLVTLTSIESKLSGWKPETNGNKLVLYDESLSSPLSGSKTILTVSFKVKDSVATGTKITISATGIIVTDGSTESSVGSVSYSVSVAAPLSTNANLGSLSVSGYTLSPTFNASTTSYSIGSVPFSTSKLTVNAVLADSTARVSISGSNLSVGKNTVTISVTAQNGSVKNYTISVNREADPNYMKSSDASLSSINLSSGTLSPVFSSTRNNYVVYVPFETTAFEISGTATDSKAQSVTTASSNLEIGQNVLKIVSTAEDGSTKEYTVTVMRMAEYIDIIDENIAVPTTSTDNTYTTDDIIASDNNKLLEFALWQIILMLILAILMGAGICFITIRQISKKRIKKDPNENKIENNNTDVVDVENDESNGDNIDSNDE